jgi:hypothetical protein
MNEDGELDHGQDAGAFSYSLVATMPIVATDVGAATLYYEPKKKAVAKAKSIQVTP